MSSFKKGQIVLAQGHGRNTFKILELEEKTEFASIRAFSVSEHAELGPAFDVPMSTLTPFNEDASQAAARIAREATENH